MSHLFVNHKYLYLLLLLLLVSCGTSALPATATPVNLEALSTQVAQTVVAQITQTAYVTPTTTTTLTPTRTKFPTRTPAPTRTPRPVYALDGKLKASIVDGDLYVQNGSGENIQRTHSKDVHDLLFSDDGQKIVFYQGDGDRYLFAIDSAGGTEQEMMIVPSLAVQEGGQIKALTFIKNTHILLFNIYLCGERPRMSNANCYVHTYTVDADSGKTEEIGQRVSGVASNNVNFALSPNQKYLAIVGSGQINIFSFSAGHFELTYFDAFAYTITKGFEFLPYQYWLPDSSGLMIVSPRSGQSNFPPDPPIFFDAFHLKLGQKADQIAFKAVITRYSDCFFSISPDRNWIIFLGKETEDLMGIPSLYLGNLRNGSLKNFDLPLTGDCPRPASSEPQWSPKNQYFGYGYSVIGVDGSTIKIEGYFGDWIDATHYSYSGVEQDGKTRITYMAEIGSEAVLLLSPTPTP